MKYVVVGDARWGMDNVPAEVEPELHKIELLKGLALGKVIEFYEYPKELESYAKKLFGDRFRVEYIGKYSKDTAFAVWIEV